MRLRFRLRNANFLTDNSGQTPRAVVAQGRIRAQAFAGRPIALKKQSHKKGRYLKETVSLNCRLL
jgi:hypothetical protein